MKWSRWLKIGVTIAFIAVLLTYFADLDKIFEQIKQIRIEYLGMAFLLSILGNALSTLRWHLIIKSRDIDLSFFLLLRYYYIGIMFNFFFPGTVGGDSVKIYKILKLDESNKTKLGGSVVLDRLMGLLIIYFAAIISLVFNSDLLTQDMVLALYGILGILTIVFLFLLNKSWFLGGYKLLMSIIPKTSKWENKISGIYDSLSFHNLKAITKKNPLFTVGIFLISFAFFYLCYVGIPYVMLIGMDTPVTYIYCASFFPLLNLIVMMPISFGGIGVRETLLVYFLSQVGVPAESAVALGILMLSFRLINGVIGGIMNLMIEK